MLRSVLRSYRGAVLQARFSSEKVERAARERTVEVEVDEETIALLERLSLVDCANRQGIRVLEDAIKFADTLHSIDTEGVEPMYTVLENRHLVLREDVVTEGNCQSEILKNASVTEEDYFVAPPGNIPLRRRENLLHLETPQKDH